MEVSIFISFCPGEQICHLFLLDSSPMVHVIEQKEISLLYGILWLVYFIKDYILSLLDDIK